MCDYDICAETQCLHGECSANYSDPLNVEPKCDCFYGYFGPECDKHLCDEITCFNGAICIVVENDFGEWKPKCNCTDEYVGENCNIVKGCEGFPCKNDGHCQSIPSNGSLIQISFN